MRASDGVAPRYPAISASAAVKRAGWMVNGPVFALMFGFPALAAALAAAFGLPITAVTWIGVIAAPVGWFAAWASWSAFTPLWRLWAYRRVADLDELKALAVEAKVLWPEGHRFERTELVSPYVRAEIERLEAEFATRRESWR